MILKHSLEIVSTDLELLGKKKHALDSLFNTGKISQSTYDYINKDLADAIIEIETHRKTLADKITIKANELEKQLKLLEMSLANLEIHFVGGEIGDEQHQYQKNALTLGLEVTKQELKDTKEALSQIISTAEINYKFPSTSTATVEEVYEEKEWVDKNEDEDSPVEVETFETTQNVTMKIEENDESQW